MWNTGHTPTRRSPFEWQLYPDGSLHIRKDGSRFTLSAADLASMVAYLGERPRCLGNGKTSRSETIPPGDAIGWDFIVGELERNGAQMWASHLVGVLLQCELVKEITGPCGPRAYRAVKSADWQSALRNPNAEDRERPKPIERRSDDPAGRRATHGQPGPSTANPTANGPACAICPHATAHGKPLSVSSSRWYVQAERWLNILNKATQYNRGNAWMIENGKAAGPCTFAPATHLLTPPTGSRYEGDVGRSTVTLNGTALAVAPTPGFPTVQLATRGSSYAVTAGAGGLTPGTQYLVHEPYAEFGTTLLGLKQRDINAILKWIGASATQTALLHPPAGNDVPASELDHFIAKFLANAAIPVLLVQGPPGTGKTHTLAATALQLLKNGCTDVACMAKTRRAVDEISQKLAQLGVAHTNKNREEQPIAGQPHCCTIDSYLYPPSKQLRANRQTLLIDEVSQLTLPVTFMAMRSGQLVRLFGDQRQLHPIVPIVEQVSEIGPHLHSTFIDPIFLNPGPIQSVLNDLPRCATLAGDPPALAAGNTAALQLYDRNAVEGLIRCMLAHPMGQSIFSLDGHPGITPQDAAAIRSIRFRLTQGYRMAAPIQEFPNSRWYDGQLKPPQRATRLDPTDESPLSTALSYPVVFITYDPPRASTGKTNKVEIAILNSVIGHWTTVAVGDFGVVVPFRAQEQAVIGGCKLRPSQCATVERFQGRDLDRVAVSLVTTDHTRYRTETRIFTENKYNVAITRARHQIVVVGALNMFDGRVLRKFQGSARTAAYPDLLKEYPQKYLEAVKAHFDHYIRPILSLPKGPRTAVWLHATPEQRSEVNLRYAIRSAFPG